MKNLNIFAFLFLFLFIVSCEEEDIIGKAEEGFTGDYELQKIELIIDGNTLVVPFVINDKKFSFKSDGTFTYPEELYFYEGKYAYSSKDKTITFSDDDPEYAYKSVLDVEVTSGVYKLKTKTEEVPSDFFEDDVSYEQEILLFTLFSLQEFEDNIDVRNFVEKIGDNAKKFSMNYYLKKK